MRRIVLSTPVKAGAVLSHGTCQRDGLAGLPDLPATACVALSSHRTRPVFACAIASRSKGVVAVLDRPAAFVELNIGV